MKGNKDPIIVILFILLAGGLYLYYSFDREELEADEYRVLEVIDGDTIIIDDGRESSVRYIGIDCPEITHEGSAGDPLAMQATRFNEELLEGDIVRLEYDEEKYDSFGRLLAYVYSDGEFVNLELVESGLAKKFTFEPNDRYVGDIELAQEEAQSERLGMWGDLHSMKEPPGNEQFLIDASDAGKYTGKRMVVEGKVSGVRETGKVTALEMGEDFRVTVFRRDRPNFEFFGIDPAAYYDGKNVRVTGRVKMYRGKPSMVVGHPMLIRVLQ